MRKEAEMSEQTTPEKPLLTTYLREAVEALRSREYSYSEAVKMHSSILGYQPTPELEEKARARVDEVSTRLILTRAALAFWERLAEVEVEAFSGPYRYDEEGVCYRTAGMAKVDTPHGEDYSHLWSSVVDDEAGGLRYSVEGYTADITEQQCLCLLAASLECRRRNEAQQ